MATASMGKFDARLPGEKPGERSMGPKRKDVGPVAAAPGQEGKKVSSKRTCPCSYADKPMTLHGCSRLECLPGDAHF